MTENMYNEYLKGLINRKLEPFKDISEETSSLISAMKDYYANP
jgi:hypothetical protein